MEKFFKREILYILTISLTFILIIFNLIKGNERFILPVFLGALLGITTFELTYHFVSSLTNVNKGIKLKIILFFFIFVLVAISCILFSNSIIYTIVGYSTFVISLFIMVLKEIFNA